MARLLSSLSHALRALALACLAAIAFGGAARAAADYRLDSGDKIRVIVYGEDDLGGEYQVDATGQVRLPLIGQIKAGGLSAHEVEASIAAALADGYVNNPRVNVEVTTYRPFYVVGEVQKPGEYPFANGMSAASAVALAGGFTPRAVESVVYIRHPGESGERRLAANESTIVRPGDVLRVDSTIFWDAVSILAPLASVSAIRYAVP